MLAAQVTETMQRARGRAAIRMAYRGGRNRLVDLEQAGCLKLMLPRAHEPFPAALPDAVVVNTAGGLTGGDRLDLAVDVEDGASLRIATQTAERIYRSAGGAAEIRLGFNLGDGARCDWLAQETILFDGGAVRRSIEVAMAPTTSFLAVEPIVLGRTAMGEQVAHGLVTDRWQVRRDGKLVYADAMRLDDFATLKAPAALGANIAMATMLLVDPAADALLDPLRQRLAAFAVTAGVSAWNGLLLARFASPDALALRRAVMAATTLVRGEALPRVWSM